MCIFAAAAVPVAAAAASSAAAVGSTAATGVAAAAAASAAAASASAVSLTSIASLALTAIGGLTSAYGMYQQGKSQSAQYAAEAKIASNNAKIAGMQADDAIKRGGEADIESKRKYAALQGKQRVTLAGNGVALDEGSALSLLEDTQIFSDIDSTRIRDNAGREAWGYRNRASNYTATAGQFSAGADAESPLFDAAGSLLGSAAEVSDRWLKFKGAY